MRPSKPSQLQLDIWNEVQYGKGNVAVEAGPGSGKTTTLLGCLDVIPKYKKSIFLSFSKAIVTELQSKMPSHCKAATLHSKGFSFLLNAGHKLRVEEDKYFKIAQKEFFPKDRSQIKKEHYREAYIIQDIITYARMTLCEHSEQALKKMCDYYTIESTTQSIKRSIELLAKATEVKGIIDFVDMIYLPVMIPGLVNQQFDYVFLDEAQDTNKCQLQFIELLLKEKGRLISVGDKNQSIYSFSGADIESFQTIQARPNTVVLPLNESYRCPTAVVDCANEIFEGAIKAHAGAKEGKRRHGYWSEIEEGDMVVSRTTRPLIALYFLLLENDIKATIVGKDIEKGLVYLAERCVSETKEGTVYNLRLRMQEKVDELKELGYNDQTISGDKSIIAMEEKIQVITLILHKIASPYQLVKKIEEIFKEDKAACKLMTIHRSKGLENKRVFIIEKFNRKKLMPSEYAIQPWEKIQEANLQFVARTRAKAEVVFIEMEDNTVPRNQINIEAEIEDAPF